MAFSFKSNNEYWKEWLVQMKEKILNPGQRESKAWDILQGTQRRIEHEKIKRMRQLIEAGGNPSVFNDGITSRTLAAVWALDCFSCPVRVLELHLLGQSCFRDSVGVAFQTALTYPKLVVILNTRQRFHNEATYRALRFQR